MAVLTFGVQGLTGGTAEPAPTSVPVTGVVGPEPLAAVFSAFPATPTATIVAAEAPGAFAADASALLGFSRSLVETSSELHGPGELNVSSAGLSRPAPGWLMAPLESLRESSPYGLRTSPLTGQSGEFHWGQDYGAACGTRVYSADAGVVRAVGWHPWGGGNRVEIDHGNGLITTYNHLEAIAVKKGDSVRVGEVIARVGTTGSSTGCHLHFETILNGAHTDPHGWKLLPTTQVDPLGAIDMISFEPEANKPSNAAIGWAIPVRTDRTHEVTGGDEETPVAAVPVTPSSPPASTVLGLPLTPSTPTTATPWTPTPGATTPGTTAPTPGTTTPGTTTPGATTPGTTAPGTSTPGGTTSKTSTPGTTTPVPGTTTPGTTTPGTTTPGTTTPGTTTPGTTTPGTTTPGTTTPGTTTPGTTAPGTPTPGTSTPGTTTPAPGTTTPGTTAPGTPAPGTPSSPTAPLPSVPATMAPSPPAATATESAKAPGTPVAPAKPPAPTSSSAPPKKSPVASAAPTTRTATPGSASASATEHAATTAPAKKPKG